ncbi:MAG TPA: tRNA (adenosine(37)-N6)-dimethylallyltransferase MiaA [bacterium]|nr:tRNA (adenosine(37)-N6)-dimethylallyltransferase MiaA [bacterium]
MTADSAFVVIAGPTAVGKTAVALALARRMPAEVVSADSRTVYRGLDIGTAKPSAADRETVPHHLIDVADPGEVFTLADYQRLAATAIDGIRRRGRVPLLVGGTGLYVRAVVDGLAIPSAGPDWALRSRLEEEERLGGDGTLHRRLVEVDPASGARIHPRNVRRVIRALEVFYHTGAAISTLQRGPRGSGSTRRNAASGGPSDRSGRGAEDEPCRHPLMVALTLDRALLHERIDQRIDRQLAAGLVDEVRRLLDAGYSPALPSLQGLGYKEIVPYVAGRATLVDAVARLRQNTRRYAKRQGTWFRADPRYRWIDVGDRSPDVVAGEISAMMAESRSTAHHEHPGRS